MEMEIMWYLKDKNCKYVGTTRDNTIVKLPLKSIKQIEKNAVPHGMCDYITSDDGILDILEEQHDSAFNRHEGGAHVLIYVYCSNFQSRSK